MEPGAGGGLCGPTGLMTSILSHHPHIPVWHSRKLPIGSIDRSFIIYLLLLLLVASLTWIYLEKKVMGYSYNKATEI